MRIANRTTRFTESVIREMTRVARENDAINLAQGFPDFSPPEEIINAAKFALESDCNQYSITWGNQELREAVAEYYKYWYSLNFDPEKEITICCGSTEAMLSSLLALVNPGEEIIAFQPYYENYGPDAYLCGAVPKFINLEFYDGVWQINWPKLEAMFSQNTAAIIINTPNNPTGKVFARDELERIASLCERYNTICISDEIYDQIIFDDKKHIPPATIPGLENRTVTINGLSKTFAVTGWRVGYVLAQRELSDRIRKVHDFVTVAAPHPFQVAGVKALHFGEEYFRNLGAFYQERRDFFYQILIKSNLKPSKPHGAYYMIADISAFGYKSSKEFCYWLAKEIGIAAVPGTSFYLDCQGGEQWVRFCFGKNYDTLLRAEEKLKKLRDYSR